MIREGQPIVLQSDTGFMLRGTVLEYDPDECLSVVTDTGDEHEFRPTSLRDFEDARGDEWTVARKNPCLPCVAGLNPQPAEKRVNPFENQRNSTMADTAADWHNERYELSLYIDNDRDLYRKKQAIEKSLETKVKRGKYDPKLAPKAWMFLVEEGAKKYCKEFRCSVRTVFPKKFVKDPLAIEYAREWEGEYALQTGKKVNPRGKGRRNPSMYWWKDTGGPLDEVADLIGAGMFKQANKRLTEIRRAGGIPAVDRLKADVLRAQIRAERAQLSALFPGNPRPRGKKVSKKSLQAAMGRAKKNQVSLRSVMGKALK
jgi:hypothetical protein